MYNDFVLIGPKSDPAGIKGMKDVGAALKAIMAKARRSSRAATVPARTSPKSISGRQAGIDIEKEKGPWYKQIGQGMGAALNTAGARTPTCCRIAAPGFRSRTSGDLVIAVEGDKRLFNQYGVMLVNPRNIRM